MPRSHSIGASAILYYSRKGGMKQGILLTFIGLLVFCMFTQALAFTIEDLIKLKKAGIPEDIIVFMVENNYKNVNKVLQLKEAGFKDKNIMTIIKSELKNKSLNSLPGEEITRDTLPEQTDFKTTAKIKILWYMMYRGEPVLQNSDTINDAKVSIVDTNIVKFEWKEKGGLGLLDTLMNKPFKSPFYWDINKNDTLIPGRDGYHYILKSTVYHKGKPATDGTHYWIIFFEPKDLKIAKYIKNALQSFK